MEKCVLLLGKILLCLLLSGEELCLLLKSAFDIWFSATLTTGLYETQQGKLVIFITDV